MKIQHQNLLLLESNVLTSKRIVDFLENKFPNSLSITTFENGEDLLKSVNESTAIVILDYDLNGESGDLILKQIKKINPNTEVIILSSDDDLATAIDAYRKGARSYIAKNKNTFSTIQTIISSIVYYPAAIIQKYLGVNQLLSIFIMEIIYIGLVVFIGFKIFT